MSAFPLRAYAAAVTTFDGDGRFDADVQRQHLRRLAQAGVSAIVGSSGAGEGYSLSDDERRELLRIARAELKEPGQFVFMAPEARSADEVIRMCELARPYKPDVIQIHGVEMGHGTRATPAEVESYLREILTAVDMPCCLCNQPLMNNFEIPVALVEALVRDYPQVVSVGELSGDIRYMAAIRHAIGDRVELWSGPDTAISLLAIGGHAFACGEANIVPELCASISAQFSAGDYERSFAAYRLLLAVSRVIRSVPTSGFGGALGRINGIGSPVPAYKAALRVLNLPGGNGVRRPRLPVDPDLEPALLAQLTELGVPELTRLTSPMQDGLA